MVLSVFPSVFPVKRNVIRWLFHPFDCSVRKPQELWQVSVSAGLFIWIRAVAAALAG